jgi:hypothetical protein
VLLLRSWWPLCHRFLWWYYIIIGVVIGVVIDVVIIYLIIGVVIGVGIIYLFIGVVFGVVIGVAIIIYLITLSLFNLLGRYVDEPVFAYVFDRSKEWSFVRCCYWIQLIYMMFITHPFWFDHAT